MAPSSGWIEQDTVTSLIVLIIFLQMDTGGGSFTMLSRRHQFVLNAGDSIELDCEFYTKYFNLFDNPVLWIKTQYHEETRINIMGNINKPFVESERFRVNFLPSPPRFRLVLQIKDLSLQDSGNYTCEVRGPATSVMTHITHSLFIRAPVEDIILNKDNCTENCQTQTPTHLTFTKNRHSLVQCVATGGNPPPAVKIYLDDQDLTYKFKSETYTRLLGNLGLRIMHSSVHTRTDNFMLTAVDDSSILRCEATVPGLPTNITSTLVRVNYAPVIICQPTAAMDNQKNVYVSCRIASRPRASTLFWVLDANGTTLTEHQMAGEFWTLVKEISDGMLETKLYMRKTEPSSFRHYTLVAENSVGITREAVQLVRKSDLASAHGTRDPDMSFYNTHDDDQGPGGQDSPHVDYIFIPAGQGHVTLPSLFIVMTSSFHVIWWWSV